MNSTSGEEKRQSVLQSSTTSSAKESSTNYEKATSGGPAIHSRSSSLQATVNTSDEATTKTAPTLVTKPAAKADPLAPTATAPYGYRAVKVRKPDGTIATVKRPLSAEQAAKVAEEKAKLDSTENRNRNADTTTRSMSEKRSPPTPNPSTKPTGGSNKTHTSDASIPASKAKAGGRQIQINEKEIHVGSPAESLTPATTDTNQSKSLKCMHHMTRFMSVLTWFIMIAFPLLFLALGITTAAMTNHKVPNSSKPPGPFQTKSKTESLDALTQARDVAVSMWPIVFAAIVAQTLRAYAAFKVERGIPLVTLEQLVASNSVAGAVKQPFMLRTFNWTSIALLVIWALSPLAGQGIVRMGRVESANVTADVDVKYFAPHKMDYDVMEFAEDPIKNIYHVSQVDSMFTGLLIGNNGSRYAPQDFWLNVKTPLYNVSRAMPYNVSEYKKGEILFTGLSGTPVWLPGSGYLEQTSTFNMTTSHYVLDCTAPQKREISSSFIQNLNLTVSPSGTLWLSAQNQTTMYGNIKTQDDAFQGPGDAGVIHFGSTDRTNNSNGKSLFYSECKYRQELTMSFVNCTGTQETANCYVSSQKPVPVDSNQQSPFQPLGRYFAWIMLHCGGNPINSSTVTETEQYIRNPAFASAPNVWNITSDSIANVTAEQMSQRFGLLVNTLWQVGTKHKALLGGNLTDIFETSRHVFPIQDAKAKAVTAQIDLYKTNWPWLSMLVVCSILLLIAGVMGVALEGRTIGPDFLGFANTAIRKGVRLPRHMNDLSARERLHALNEAEVLLQDARPNEDRGRVVLGIKEENSVRLVKHRVYR